MKNILLSGIIVCLMSTSLYAGKGKLRVSSKPSGAYVYVDGKKKAMTGEGFTSILLEEGEHIIKVEKEVDYLPLGDWVIKEEKKVFVGEDTSVKLRFNNLKKALSKNGIKNIKKNQIQNAIFTPIGRNSDSYKKHGCYENLSIYNDKYFTCGSNNIESKGFIFNRKGKKIGNISGDIEYFRYLNDGKKIQIYQNKRNNKWMLEPKLIDKNNNVILKYKSMRSENGDGFDIYSNKVLFFRSAGTNSNLRNGAWIRNINTGKLITKIIIPKKLDGWDGFFKFSEDGNNILFSSGKSILVYNLKGVLLKTIKIGSLNKKYKNDRWYIVDINYNNGLFISVFERYKDTLDIVKLDNHMSKVLIPNIKTPRYYSNSVAISKKYIAISNESFVKIYNLSGKFIGNLDHRLSKFPGTECHVVNIFYSKDSNTILTECGIWSF